MKNNLLYIVMPAYNEEENLSSIVLEWHKVAEKVGKNARLLIVNDGSIDKTYSILLELQKQYPQLIVESKPNSGHGATCLFAYRKAIEANADYIFQTDSDGQTNPDDFAKFWENRIYYDFIIGSRNSRQDGFSRLIISKVLKLLVWIIFGVSIKDANAPFRLMKADKIAELMKFIPENFFLSNVAISVIAMKKNICCWIPITFKPRQAGVNSINIKMIVKVGFNAINDFIKIKRLIEKH
jgi:dolichol-phosphate mannosyltransferase